MNVHTILGAARLAVMRRHPYFGALAWRVRMKENQTSRGIGITTGATLNFDPGTVQALGPAFAPSMLSLMIQTVARGQHARWARLRPLVAPRFKAVAQDMAAIGIMDADHLLSVCGAMEIVDDFGWPVPENYEPGTPIGNRLRFPHPTMFDLKPNMLMEQYVEELLRRFEQDANQSGGTNEGNDEGEEGSAGDCAVGGRVRDNDHGEAEPGAGREDSRGSRLRKDTSPGGRGNEKHDNVGGDAAPFRGGFVGWLMSGTANNATAPTDCSPQETELARRQVAVAVLDAAARGDQSLGALLDWARDMIKPARMNPRAVLASALRGASAAVRGSSSRTYAKPSRRREVLRMTMGDEAPILPGYRGDEPKAVVVLDTSGSMGRDRMGAALSELVGLARAAALPLWALAVDADVHAERQIKTQKDALDLAKGGGGTDMRAGIAAAQEPRRKANIIVVITDGETPWPTAHEMPKEQRLVLVIVNQSRRVMHHVPAYLQTHAFYLPVGEMAQ